jgi:hypothetical protein
MNNQKYQTGCIFSLAFTIVLLGLGRLNRSTTPSNTTVITAKNQ